MVEVPFYLRVRTSDTKVWDLNQHCADISFAMASHRPLIIDLLWEGPDFHQLELYSFIITESKRYDYDLKNITLNTCNILEADDNININRRFPWHLHKMAIEYDDVRFKNKDLKHFGLFVGRSNPARLTVSSSMYEKHRDKMIHTNHLDLNREFYSSNFSFDDVVNEFGIKQMDTLLKYVSQCPINADTIEIDKTKDRNAAQQLLDQDRDCFLSKYQDFFIEIVCETFYTGETFFPTEKIWRPIVLKTPFIVQGSCGFLGHLRHLGFKTFSNWWNEGYNQDQGAWSVHALLDLVDELSKLSQPQIYDMYESMQDVLEHNRARFFELYQS